MFGRSQSCAIDTLVSALTSVDGGLYFKGGLRIDGRVNGDVIADPGTSSTLIVAEGACVEGDIQASKVFVYGKIVGAVHATEFIELRPAARIDGDVRYKALEIHGGALVCGRLTHDAAAQAVATQAGNKVIRMAGL